jgi:hypothetical protein
MNTIFIIYSCKKNLKNAKLLYNLLDTKINCKCLIMYGDTNLPVPFMIQGPYLVLKCRDEYEYLCEKTFCLCNAVAKVFPTYGMFKCDDDIIPNVIKINSLLEFVNDGSKEYLGNVCNNEINESKSHYNKCSSAKYNVPRIVPKTTCVGGPFYYLNTKSIQIVSRVNYSSYFYEDVMVGHVLNKNNILPHVNYPLYSDNMKDSITTCVHNNYKRPKLYVILMGGLGNQLFQIQTAYLLSKKCDFMLVVLIQKNFKNIMQHNNSYDEYMNTVFSKINYTYYENVDLSNVCSYREPKCFDYDPDIIEHVKDYLIIGYFQHKKYFHPEIINVFKNEKICNELQVTFPNLNESYFIHFRLGDYTTPTYYNTYYFDKDKYYSAAIEYVLNINKDAHFYILSDDEEFIKTYPMLADLNKTIVSGLDTVQSLYLMSLCHYGGICANSTFSGWGATLNENKDKLVICPKQWINVPYNYEIPFHHTISF